MITALLGRFWWQIPAVIGALGMIATCDLNRKAKWVNQGKQEVRVQIQEATRNGLKNAESAGRKSANPTAPGVRSPYYRD